VQNLRGEPRWLHGIILEQTGPISYQVSVNDQIWRRHIDQLRFSGLPSVESSLPKESVDVYPDEYPFREQPDSTAETVPSVPEPCTDQAERRYPQRECRPTQRLIENT